MAIQWNCSHCGRKLSVAGRKAGHSKQCPACGQTVTVPVPSDSGSMPVCSTPQAAPRHSSRAAWLTVFAGSLLLLGAGAALAWKMYLVSRAKALPEERQAAEEQTPPSTPDAVLLAGEPLFPILHDPVAEPASDPGTDPQPPPAPQVPHKDPDGPTGPHALRVAADGNAIVVTDRLTGKEVWRKEATAPIRFLAFAPDGKTVISQDEQGETCTWDAVTGNLEKREAPKPEAVVAKPVVKPEEPKPMPVAALDPEELRASLLKVKELDFYPAIDALREAAINSSMTKKDLVKDQQLRQAFQALSPPTFMTKVNGVLLKKAAEEGLPLVPRQSVRMSAEAAKTMDVMSKQLRLKGFVSVPGSRRSVIRTGRATGKLGVAPQASAQATELQAWCKENHIERYAGALNTFLQMLQVEDDATRMVLVEELGKVESAASTNVLVARAIFDLAPEVRQAAVDRLKKRRPETYRSLMLKMFRYPWAPAAAHAADALASLDDKKAIPQLVALLDQPDPCLPVVDAQRGTGTVRELVRINHMRNCFLCHAVSSQANDLVRGAVPRPGQPLPQMYYNNASPSDFVQANTTYLRQDFSVAQPVENASPWPDMQRYDYVVRVRRATPDEMVEMKDAPAGDYPQRNAVLAALRRLSGRDLGTSSEAWQRYAASLAPGKESPATEQTPKENEKTETSDGR